MRAFSAEPYDAVSTEAIAARAGISQGLLFHYFPTKRAYYLAVLALAAEQLLEETLAAHVGSPAERLRAGLHAYFGFVAARGETYATLLRAGVGADPLVFALVERTRQRYVDAIRDALAPLAADAGAASLRAGLRAWIGLVEALALDWIDHRDLARDELVAMAVRGLLVAVPGAERAL